jgi:hypothetical protein
MGASKRHANEHKVTRPAWTFAAACLALVLVAVASGCGSNSSGSSAKGTAFASRANAICTTPQPGPSPGPFPFPSFNPLNPDPSKLPAIGRYFKRANSLPNLRGELAQLSALGKPPKDEADWQRLLAAKQFSLRAVTAQIKAALATNVPQFTGTVKALIAATNEERATASRFGAPGCAPPGPGQQAGPPPGAPAVPPQARLVLTQLAACMRANGIPVQANTSGNGPPLTTSLSPTDPRYQAAGAKCRAQLASRFPVLGRVPTPP